MLKINVVDCRFWMIFWCFVKSWVRFEDEFLKVLINVVEVLVWLYGKNLMYWDIIWWNVFRNILGINWVLIDFDEIVVIFCGYVYGLCVEVYVFEMSRGCYDLSVDIWGIGYLIRSSGINGLLVGVWEL